MKSVELLSSNLPRVIDWSNLSPRRKAMTRGKLLENNPTLFIFYFLNKIIERKLPLVSNH